MDPQPPKPSYMKPLVAGIVGVGALTLAIMLVTNRERVADPSRSAAPLGSGYTPKPPQRRIPRVPRDGTTAVVASSASPVTELIVPKAKSPIVADGEVEDEAWRGTLGRTGTFTDPQGQNVRPYSDARFLWGDGKLYVVLYAADEDIRTAEATAQPAASGSAKASAPPLPPSASAKLAPSASAALAAQSTPTASASSKPEAASAGDVPLDSFHLLFEDGKVTRSIEVSPLGSLTEGSRPSSSPADAPFSVAWKSGATLGHDLDGTPNDPKDQDEEWVIEMAIPLASIGLEGKAGEKIGFSVSRCDKPKDTPRVCGGWGTAHPSSLILE